MAALGHQLNYVLNTFVKRTPGASFMKYLRFKLKILSYGIRVNFSLKKELKPKFLLSCFVKLGPDEYTPFFSMLQTIKSEMVQPLINCNTSQLMRLWLFSSSVTQSQIRMRSHPVGLDV